MIMKTLKISYYICFGICLIQLCIYLFAPFAGSMGIINYIKNGLFTVSSGYRIIDLNFPPYSNNPYTENLLLLNRTLAFVYFLSLIVCCLLPVFYKMDLRTKYKIGIIACGIALTTFIGGGKLFHYLVTVYLDIA